VTAEMGWGMVVKRDKAELFAPLRQGIFFIILSGLIAMIIVFVLAMPLRKTLPLLLNS